MKILHFKGKLQGLKAVEHKLCESCVLGKWKRVNFSKTRTMQRPTKLELVYTDVWGLLKYLLSVVPDIL